MSRAILIGPCFKTSGELKRLSRKIHISRRDFVVAVDRGLDWAKEASLHVNLAVGDWDSVSSMRILRGFKTITLPRDKSRSDLFYACSAALNAGAEELIVLGAGGGRVDHFLAAIQDLRGFSGLVPVRMVNADSEMFFLSERVGVWKGRLRLNTLVSVFALSDVARGVTLSGFRFPLFSVDLEPSSHGLSNCVSSGRSCSIQVKRGYLLIVIPF